MCSDNVELKNRKGKQWEKNVNAKRGEREKTDVAMILNVVLLYVDTHYVSLYVSTAI